MFKLKIIFILIYGLGLFISICGAWVYSLYKGIEKKTSFYVFLEALFVLWVFSPIILIGGLILTIVKAFTLVKVLINNQKMKKL